MWFHPYSRSYFTLGYHQGYQGEFNKITRIWIWNVVNDPRYPPGSTGSFFVLYCPGSKGSFCFITEESLLWIIRSQTNCKLINPINLQHIHHPYISYLHLCLKEAFRLSLCFSLVGCLFFEPPPKETNQSTRQPRLPHLSWLDMLEAMMALHWWILRR